MLPEDPKDAVPIPRAAPKLDDVALIAKALDALEAKSGKTPALADAKLTKKYIHERLEYQLPSQNLPPMPSASSAIAGTGRPSARSRSSIRYDPPALRMNFCLLHRARAVIVMAGSTASM